MLLCFHTTLPLHCETEMGATKHFESGCSSATGALCITGPPLLQSIPRYSHNFMTTKCCRPLDKTALSPRVIPWGAINVDGVRHGLEPNWVLKGFEAGIQVTETGRGDRPVHMQFRGFSHFNG